MDSVRKMFKKFVVFLVEKTEAKEVRWQQVRMNPDKHLAAISNDSGKASIELTYIPKRVPQEVSNQNNATYPVGSLWIRVVIRRDPHLQPGDFSFSQKEIPELTELHKAVEAEKKQPAWVESWIEKVIKDDE